MYVNPGSILDLVPCQMIGEAKGRVDLESFVDTGEAQDHMPASSFASRGKICYTCSYINDHTREKLGSLSYIRNVVLTFSCDSTGMLTPQTRVQKIEVSCYYLTGTRNFIC